MVQGWSWGNKIKELEIVLERNVVYQKKNSNFFSGFSFVTNNYNRFWANQNRIVGLLVDKNIKKDIKK